MKSVTAALFIILLLIEILHRYKDGIRQVKCHCCAFLYCKEEEKPVLNPLDPPDSQTDNPRRLY